MKKFKHLALPDDIHKHIDYIKAAGHLSDGHRCMYTYIGSCRDIACIDCWLSLHNRRSFRENLDDVLAFATAEKQANRKWYKCSACDDHSCTAKGKKPEYCLRGRNKPDWERMQPPAHVSKEPESAPQSPQPPPQPLTVDIFKRTDCPSWAKFAAVDKNGIAYWYAERPFCSGWHWRSRTPETIAEIFGCRFLSADWKNSLIERVCPTCGK